MVAGQAGGDIKPEGRTMNDAELFCWWLIALALPVVRMAVGLGAYVMRRRQRHDPFYLLGAEVRRLNTRKAKATK